MPRTTKSTSPQPSSQAAGAPLPSAEIAADAVPARKRAPAKKKAVTADVTELPKAAKPKTAVPKKPAAATTSRNAAAPGGERTPSAPRRKAAPLPRLTDDLWLSPYHGDLERRKTKTAAMAARLTGDGAVSLEQFALGHLHYGLHRTETGWVFREWAPNATAISLIGDFSDWTEKPEHALRRINEHGDWELELPAGTLAAGMHYRLRMHWHGGSGDRIPAWCRRVTQDPETLIFSAQIYEETTFAWKKKRPDTTKRPPLIYEAHVGMAQEKGAVGSYTEFRDLILPRIVAAGYNTVQLMGILEHPYYGSFGYHVSSFFAPSSRFGTPDEFKSLVDTAHGLGLSVIIDIIHSHAVKNEAEGLSRFDGSPYQYFHAGPRGDHPAWDSRCFDYAKPAVLHFLLSNCRYWIEDYNLDGFRFDGVTSMLYFDHGLGKVFTSYADYFNPGVDEEALAYLTLANRLIHSLNPKAITIAEDVSGMPGLVSPEEEGGTGFDYRLAMGVPDLWEKLGSSTRDENWHVEHIYHELTNRRAEEKVISYVESHDQAIVGGKSFIFRLLDSAIYTDMHTGAAHPHVDRGVALWKMARLLTLATSPHGYLNFIGNEFGHPEWVDFPREGNHWSSHYARRQWSLRDNPGLKYHALGDFDAALMKLFAAKEFFTHRTEIRLTHVSHQLIAFQRGNFLIVANFHPWNSPVDHPLNVPEGTWRLVLDTDEERFAGLKRLRPGQEYLTRPVNGGHEILAYLPARAAMVLEHVAR